MRIYQISEQSGSRLYSDSESELKEAGLRRNTVDRRVSIWALPTCMGHVTSIQGELRIYGTLSMIMMILLFIKIHARYIEN